MSKSRYLSAYMVMVVILLLTACASSDILEPIDLSAEPSKGSPSYERISSLFKTLGYEGVGLQFESDVTLDFLHQIFSDPSTHQRDISTVYTGIALSYDPHHKSLTVGGATNPKNVIAYIQKVAGSR